MSVEEKYWSPDGCAGVWLKEVVDDEETGPFLRAEGAKSVQAKKANNSRTVLADNMVYKDTTKFQKFDITLTLAAVRPDMMPFYAPGTLTVESPTKARFDEKRTGLPKKFNMYVFSDADENGGGVAVLPRVYYNCRAQSLDADSNSGDYGDVVVAITGLSDPDDNVRTWIFDEDLVGVDVDSGDTTRPTVADVTCSAGTWPGSVTVSADIRVDFSEEMDEASVESTDHIRIRKVSDNSIVAATNTYTAGTPFRLAINPTANLSAATVYAVQVRTLVKDEAGNYMEEEYTELFTTA